MCSFCTFRSAKDGAEYDSRLRVSTPGEKSPRTKALTSTRQESEFSEFLSLFRKAVAQYGEYSRSPGQVQSFLGADCARLINIADSRRGATVTARLSKLNQTITYRAESRKKISRGGKMENGYRSATTAPGRFGYCRSERARARIGRRLTWRFCWASGQGT